MIAARDQLEHFIVHLDKTILSKRLLFLPVFECLSNLLLEVARLDRVNDLKYKKNFYLR
jgi:hypothetical protein